MRNIDPDSEANQLDGADNEREVRSLQRMAAIKEPTPVTLLQAVLDAIYGTLDTSAEIADHPNVKFAQMQRMELTERLAAAIADRDSAFAKLETAREALEWIAENGHRHAHLGPHARAALESTKP